MKGFNPPFKKWITKEEVKKRLKHYGVAFKDIEFIFQNYSGIGHKYRNRKDDYCEGCVVDAIFTVKYFKVRFGRKSKSK